MRCNYDRNHETSHTTQCSSSFICQLNPCIRLHQVSSFPEKNTTNKNSSFCLWHPKDPRHFLFCILNEEQSNSCTAHNHKYVVFPRELKKNLLQSEGTRQCLIGLFNQYFIRCEISNVFYAFLHSLSLVVYRVLWRQITVITPLHTKLIQPQNCNTLGFMGDLIHQCSKDKMGADSIKQDFEKKHV